MKTILDGMLGQLESYFVSMRGVSSSHAVGGALACLAAMTRSSGPGLLVSMIDERGTGGAAVCRAAEQLLDAVGLERSILGSAIAADPRMLQRRIETWMGSIIVSGDGPIGGGFSAAVNEILLMYDAPVSALITRRVVHTDDDNRFYGLEVMATPLPSYDMRPHSVEIPKPLLAGCRELVATLVGEHEFDPHAEQLIAEMQARNRGLDSLLTEQLISRIAALLAINEMPRHPTILPCHFVLAFGISINERVTIRGNAAVRQRYAEAMEQIEAERVRLEADNHAQKVARQKPGFKAAPQSAWWALDDPRLEADRKAHRARRPPFH